MNNFHAAMFQANLLYGVEVSPEDFEEIGLVAWHRIGNKRTRLYRYVADVNCSNNTVKLPCNCDIIEAVTYDFEDWNYVDKALPEGDINSGFTESYIEGRKAFENPLYQSGRYVKYERVGDTLYLDQNYGGRITILYKGELVDDEGLPELTDKEVDAIATYVALVIKSKEVWQISNPRTLKATSSLLSKLEQQWNKLCDAARVPVNFSQNEMNTILDAKTSWNRKIFNKSLKPLK